MTHRPRHTGAGVTLALLAASLFGSGLVHAASHDISIVDFEFKPADTTVFTGEPVSWTNDGAATHNVTSIEGTELASGDLGPNEGFGHVFETPGEFAYHCTIHPDRMKGTITVRAAAATPTPSGPPEPTPPAGTLPPDFSPFPSVGPEVTPAPGPSTTPQPSATPAPVDSTGGSGSGLLLPVIVGAGIGGLLVALWLRRRRAP